MDLITYALLKRQIAECETNIKAFIPHIGENENWYVGDEDTGKPSRGDKGPDGKSAYSYAQDGGYTGTEAEFAAKLAADIPTVDETLTEQGMAADAKATGDAIRSLSAEIDNLSGGTGISGLTVETITVDDSSGDVPVEAISLDYSSLSLVVGETTQLAASVTPSNATNTAITWETSDSTIATVNAGLVTAVAPGDCTITAKSVENSAIMATCTVVVTAAGSGGTAGEKVQFTTLPYIAGTLKKKDGTTTNIAYGNYVEIPYTDGMKVSTGMNPGWVGNYPPFAVQDGDTYTVVEHDVGAGYNLVGSLFGKLYTTTLSGYSENAKVFVNFYVNTENADQLVAMDELDGFWYIPGGEA